MWCEWWPRPGDNGGVGVAGGRGGVAGGGGGGGGGAGGPAGDAAGRPAGESEERRRCREALDPTSTQSPARS